MARYAQSGRLRTVGLTHEVAQVFNGEDFSEIFKGIIRNNYTGSLAAYGKTMLAFESFEGPHVRDNRSFCRVLKQAVQQGRSESGPRAYPLGVR